MGRWQKVFIRFCGEMRLTIVIFLLFCLNNCSITNSQSEQNHIKKKLDSKANVISNIKTGITINY